LTIQIRLMTIEDYDEVLALWQSTPGIGLSSADSKESIARLLEHNPGLSFVAFAEGMLVGAVLGSSDSRRGYLHHLAVKSSHWRYGIGKILAENCLNAFKAQGIQKCHIFVFTNNHLAIAFWEHIGWTQREDIMVMSKNL
jgi:N-acetylglutamate synthase